MRLCQFRVTSTCHSCRPPLFARNRRLPIISCRLCVNRLTRCTLMNAGSLLGWIRMRLMLQTSFQIKTTDLYRSVFFSPLIECLSLGLVSACSLALPIPLVPLRRPSFSSLPFVSVCLPPSQSSSPPLVSVIYLFSIVYLYYFIGTFREPLTLFRVSVGGEPSSMHPTRSNCDTNLHYLIDLGGRS